MDRYRFRAPLARAKSLGPARTGFEHWWAERATAVALVPLTVWFAASVIAYGSTDYETFVIWLGSPLTTIMIVLLLTMLFRHMFLGLQVIIEDYVHSGVKIWALMAAGFLCFALAITGIVAALRVAFAVQAAP